MRQRIQARRKASPQPQTAPPTRSHLAARPFPVADDTLHPPTQAQQERVARPSPSVIDIPLYPPAAAGGTEASAAAPAVQMQPDEANLTPPRGTLQRQQMDEQNRDQQLNLMPETGGAMLEDDDKLQRQPAATEDEEATAKAIQNKEEEQNDKLQAKAEAELEEAEADEEIQQKEDEKEELQAKLEHKHSESAA